MRDETKIELNVIIIIIIIIIIINLKSVRMSSYYKWDRHLRNTRTNRGTKRKRWYIYI